MLLCKPELNDHTLTVKQAAKPCLTAFTCDQLGGTKSPIRLLWTKIKFLSPSLPADGHEFHECTKRAVNDVLSLNESFASQQLTVWKQTV